MQQNNSQARHQILSQWVAECLGQKELRIEPASEDASFRRYWRVTVCCDPQGEAEESWIVMDAPPEHEDCRPFIEVSERLRRAGIQATQVLTQNLEHGFLLLSDLGDRQYLAELNAQNVEALYQDAFDTLLVMQRDVDPGGLPDYSREILIREMLLFKDWLLDRHLGLDCNATDGNRSGGRDLGAELDDCFGVLADSALEQPQVFVHLDYHSRNLMLCSDPPGAMEPNTDAAIANSVITNPIITNPIITNPGVLDFQDARRGPITYDLVSLIRDCYVRWPDEQVRAWSEQYHESLASQGIAKIDPAQWTRWFDWMGIQRHLKAAGIFARLWHRDGKHWFLQDVPRTLGYVCDVGQHYPEMSVLVNLIQHQVLPRLEEQQC